MRFRVAAFFSLMSRQERVWAGLACLWAVGCSGQAQEDVQSSDGGIGSPPSGFYSILYESVSDSCEPLQPQGTVEGLMTAAGNGLEIPIWQTGQRRQDIAWDQPFMYTWTECGASITLDVTAKTARSFVIDSQMDWVNPTACATLAWLGVPPSDCTVHQRETFELEQACPATRDGFSCQ
jgi:hypothetical protein